MPGITRRQGAVAGCFLTAITIRIGMIVIWTDGVEIKLGAARKVRVSARDRRA